MAKLKYTETIQKDVDSVTTAHKYLNDKLGKGVFTLTRIFATSNMRVLKAEWSTDTYKVKYNISMTQVSNMILLNDIFWEFCFEYFVKLCVEKHDKVLREKQASEKQETEGIRYTIEPHESIANFCTHLNTGANFD